MTCYAFGDFELDTELCELRHRGDTLPLGARLVDALAYLIAHRNRTVSPGELVEHVWPDEALSGADLSSRLTSIRKAIDGAPDREPIETIEGEGLRFVAEVEERTGGAAGLLERLELRASSLFQQGEFERTLRVAEEALDLEAPAAPAAGALAEGKDPRAACHGWAALALWFLGHPDQASEQAAAALEAVKEPERSHGLPFTETQMACFHQLRREPEAVHHLVTALARRTGREPLHRRAAAAVLSGWSEVYRSERARAIARGLARIEAGLAGYGKTEEPIGLFYLLGVHAEALQRAGQLDEALAQIRAARKVCPRSQPTFWHAELDRLEGCIYLEKGDGQRGETSLRHARDLARRQGALTIELRTACCQARLLDSRGDTRGARRLLSKVYGKFDEGHRTPDLREAAALLETL